MPLQSSGIIVVEKPTTATIATQQQQQQQHLLQTATATVQKSVPEIQYYEYYDANDVRQQHQQQQHQQPQHAVVVDSNNGSQQQQQQQLVRRSSHQRTNSGSNSNSSTTTIQQFNIKHQQQMHHHQQPQQIIQHTTTHQAPQQQQHVQQQQQQQQPPHQQQQVIQVSEEFIEQATAGNMMISTTGEVLNQQIFKIISSDGGNGNMILDSMGNTPNNSKVLLSNVTVLSKQAPSPATTASNNMNVSGAGQHHPQQQQQQPQTINFVSAKNLSYLTSTATSVPSATSTTTNGKQQKFTVAGAYKTSAKLQQQQQQMTTTTTTYMPSSSPQQHQQQQQIVQKVTVPRNVQMVTRVQTLMQSSGGTTHQQQLQSPQQQQQTQMLVQQPQKYIAATGISGSKTASNMLKKSGTMKMSQNKLLNNLQQQQGVKTFIPQQQQQHQQQTHYQTTSGGSNSKIKSKLVKQYNNAINNSTGAVSIATLPQQQQQQSSLGTYTINHKANNHQQTTTTTKITKLSSNKYVMQNHQQQLQHVATLPQGTQLHHKTMHQNISNNSSIMLQQQMINTSNSGGNSNSSAGTIKFVNAHGTVIQQHQTQAPIQQQEKLSTTLHRQQQPQHYQQQQLHFLETSASDNNNSGSGSSNIYQLPATSQQQQSSVSPSQSSLLSDDIMIVNGTQMTDEISARILQSMAQKSFGNQQRYQQQKTNMPPPPQQIVVQHGASSAVGISAAASNILLSPKEYPLYSPMPQQQQQQQSQQSTAQYVQQTTYLPMVSSASQSSATISSYSTTSSSSSANSAASRPVVHSAPGSRSQSMERKLHETSITRKSSEYFKVNTNEIIQSSRFYAPSSSSAFSLSPTSTLIDIIPLPICTNNSNNNSSSNNINTMRSNSTSGNSSTQSNATIPIEQTPVIHLQNMKTTQAIGNYASAPNAVASNDDDIIGEEVRPVPVNTQDLRLQILHAVQQDHTYANTLPARLPSDVNAQQMVVGGSTIAGGSTLLSVGNANSNRVGSSVPAVAQSPLGQSALIAGGQQWSLGGIGAVAVAGHSIATNAVAVGGSAAVTSSVILSNAAQSSYTLYGQQIPRMQQDDDAHSAISNGSRVAMGDCDPGEETETAPEAEAEDDSVTRCICDLTHDDGYMICCDKCFAWQHVDCMGIDRQNIPDEYLCELCQPRAVDKVRARSLQLMKRKEQQTQMLLTAQVNAAGAMGTASGGVIGAGGTSLLPNDVLAQQRLSHSFGGGNFNLTGDATLQTLSAAALANNSLHPLKKGKVLKKTKDAGGSKKSKKAEKLAAAGGGAGGLSGVGGKPPRKETKKNAKRKTKGGEGSNSGVTAAEKYAANLRHWIENYELAVTNHYSPELRARLHAITKQPSLLQSILNTENRALKDCGSLENKSTTVPHAGGKILISNLNVGPNCPIVELRGKYMLTTQYKTQNASINIPTSPNHNYPISYKAPHKVPGPFIFFYQLPGAEAPMQTMNPDGTYPPLPPQPAYLKGPEVCVDTRTYGNEARFVRRSCRPNAEIQHLFEKGTIHLFIVSLTDIRASTEITIRHEPHDLLALENKKSNNFIFQPTSTGCGCGLTKDCLFPPPAPSTPTAATKSSRNKPITLNGGAMNSSAAMQLTMGGLPTVGGGVGKKKCPQSINRNRSTSSSGDSNMGLNSPNITQMNLNAACNSSNNSKSTNNNSNILSMAVCSNMSNASSSMSSVMHDSGICTSSSSPSVSIPSPTSHIHSPTQQQQQQQQQQQHQQQLLLPLALPQPLQQPPPSTVVQRTLIMQQSPQHQQILAAVPTPMLPSPQLPQQQKQPQQQPPQQLQQIAVQPMPQPQPTLEVIAAAAAAQTPIAVLTPTTVMKHEVDNEHQQQQPQQHPQQQHAIFMQMTQPQQLIPSPVPQQTIVEPTIIATNEDTLAAAALQALNSSASSLPTTPIVCEPQLLQHQQQPQFQQLIPQQQLQAPVEVVPPQQVAAPQHTAHMVVSSPMKSPQKHIAAVTVVAGAPVASNCGRKTPAKHPRTTSVSEDVSSEHHSNDDGSSGSVAHTSTPKDKPKLSREDRKMEAILRAIEKMEKNQQRKQELKQSKSVSKRRNSNSNSPASPTKRTGANSSADLDSSTPNTSAVASFSGMKKNPLSARKKKRKSHKSYNMHGSQRKRRKSRMNSNESDVDAAVTSESESTSMLSPPIQTTAGSSGSVVNTCAVATIVENCTAAAAVPAVEMVYSNDTDTATVDAGLLMAFANPKSPEEEHLPQQLQQQQQPQPHSADLLNQHYAIEGLKSPQHLQSANEGTASPPPTPPAPVSSACLLIEAAVGPLEQFDGGSTPGTCGEFKYPGKTKTKKVLMSNWLHETEVSDISSNIMVTSPHNTSPNISPVANTPPPNTGLSLGLESLVQAAMSDYKQQQHEPNPDEAPQNLSMAAKKVEEFIYQTEGNNSPMDMEPTQTQRPSYSLQRTNEQYNYKPPTAATLASVTRNLQLPLQVSSCSNNSSVKKRWLRQAISEETDENSMTPSSTPTTASPTAHLNAGNPFINVPNGFTTPLKKRRLVISSKDEDGNGQLVLSSTPPLANALDSSEMETIKIEPEQVQGPSGSSSPMATDDVDVVGGIKCEEEAESEIVDVGHENISRPATPTLTATVIKHEAEPMEAHSAMHREDDIKSEMIMDQDDDVDILRSPSPGQQMVAEDNLVKIEPEDISGGDDVKIDVEREESMAGDKFEEIMQVKKEEETALSAVSVGEETKALKLPSDETNQSTKIETEVAAVKFDQPLVKATEVKSEGTSLLVTVKKEEAAPAPKMESMGFYKQKLDNAISKSDEPVKKKPKLEPQTSLLKPLIAKPVTHFPLDSNCTSLLAAAAAAAALALPPPPPPPHTTNTTAPHVSSTVATTAAATLIASSVVSTTSSSCTTATADSTSSTPTNRKNNERKNLSDDDIQERLLSFHKENILFLQSRNKKSKTGSGSSSSSSTPEGKSKSEAKAQSDAKTTAAATTTPKNKHKSSSGGISSSSKKSHKKDRNSTSSRSSSKSSSKVKTPTATCPSSLTPGSSLSSKKLKALKKSSSSSSTSSSASNSNAIATSVATSSTSDKEKNRHRTTSTSSTSSSTSTSKKRQLNFEQELTKDMHLASIVKLRKEGKDEASSSGTRKRRESSCGSREENRSCTNSITPNSNKHKSTATSSSSDKKPSESANKSTTPVAATASVVAASSTTTTNATTITTTSASSTTTTLPSEDKSSQQVQFSRVHPTIPHFNNIVTTPSHGNQTIKPLTVAFTVPPPPLRSNPPVQFNIAQSNLLKTLPVPIPLCGHSSVAPLNTLPPTAVANAGTAMSTTTPPPPPSPNSTVAANSLPYYNTIYGKLLDTPQPLLPQQLQPPLQPQPSATTPSIVPPPSLTLMGVQTAALPAAAPLPVPTTPSPTAAILSEYLDTKVKSYNTLGSYVSHTSFFGVNASTTKSLLPPTPATIISIADLIETPTPAVATHNTSSGSIEMPSPTTPPAIGANKLPTPLKILTKTASHDPRLNPILTAPELPPAPKRKLSINEYRKRMQQSTDSSSAPSTPLTPDLGGALAAATSTTSAFSLTCSSNSFSNAFNSVTSSGSHTAATINKCSLNSPERFDSGCAKDQLIDEKLLTDPLNSSSSLYASSNSSESMHKLNEEYDSTKGQFSAAPTLLEKQQENLCERLKSLKSKQSAATLVAGRLTALGNDFGLKKDTGLYLNRNSSASDLDHCLEAISSSSTSLASSRESSPERFSKKDGGLVSRHHHNDATTVVVAATEKEAEAKKGEGNNA